MSKLILWGTGYKANILYHELLESADYNDDEIVVFCDSYRTEWNSFFYGVPVVAPDKIKNIDFDIIVIANSYVSDIKEIIKKDELCPENKIRTIEQFRAELFAKRQFFEKNGKIHQGRRVDGFQAGTAIVYTAIIGDYDNLYEPEYTDANIKYICFTDQSNLSSNIWNIKKIKQSHYSNVKLARHIKMLPWEYMDIHEDLLFWVDAKYLIKKDLRTYSYEYGTDKGVLCFPHPDNGCICNEMALLIRLGKGEKDKMIHQVSEYLEEGYPLDNGLFETACLVRKPSDRFVRDLMEQWWGEIERFSYRDQLSLPYICWKNDFWPDICDMNIRMNPWIELMGHKAKGTENNGHI